MKTSKLYIILLIGVAVWYGCDPIEEESLRDKYYNDVGTPITKVNLKRQFPLHSQYPIRMEWWQVINMWYLKTTVPMFLESGILMGRQQEQEYKNFGNR